jgi:putative acetyltransferase
LDPIVSDHLRIETCDPQVGADLIAASDAYMSKLYPAESNHFEDIAALRLPNVTFVVGYLAAEVVACGAVKIMADDGPYGEVKRVYVLETQRGRGHSSAIMDMLESTLRSAGVSFARLETGILQPEALGLYRKRGYFERGPFGKYQPDPLSVFMERQL